MKKIDFGQTVTILANVGVIAGIVFLAVELHQNNDLLRAQASFNRFSVERYRRTQVTENVGGLGEIMYKKSLGETLSGLDEFRYNVAIADLLDSLRWQYSEMTAGRLPENSINFRDWRGIFGLLPEISQRLRTEEESWDPDFNEFVKENIEDRVNR
jgi:hypothetical protein